MMAWISTIPPSIMLLLNGVVIALLGVYFSRKKNRAELTTKNIEGAQKVWEEYEKRIERLERNANIANQENIRLSSRVASLEHNDASNQKWIGELEQKNENLQKEYQGLKTQYRKLQQEHKELKDRVDNGNGPEAKGSMT